MTRGEKPQKSPPLIRAAERFRPLHKFMGVELVQKIETGLEYGQQLLRILMITVTGAKLLHVHSVSPFCRQPLTPIEPPFDFQDQHNSHKLMQRPKTFRRANQRRRFLRLLNSSHAPAGAQCFSVFFGNC
jgi:hypothetical protein